MKPDRQVIKQVELSLKFLAKDLRNGGAVDSSKVSAVAKLLSDYNELLKSVQEDDLEPNYYDQMEQEAFRDMKSRQ
jgi:hypothetical protein